MPEQFGQFTPPAGYQNGEDNSQDVDPQGADTQTDPQSQPQQTDTTATPEADPLATYKLQDGSFDSNLMSEAILEKNKETEGLKRLIDEQTRQINQMLAASGQAPVPKPQTPATPQADPIEAILAEIDENSVLGVDEYRRMAQIVQARTEETMNKVFAGWSQQMQQHDQAQAQRQRDVTLQQTRNQFGTVMKALSVTNPDLPSMEQELVQELDNDPTFREILQGMMQGGRPFTQEEASDLILNARDNINARRQQQFAQLQQQMGLQPQTPAAQPQAPQAPPPTVDSFGRPLQPAQGPTPGQVPGQIPANYAQQVAQQNAQKFATEAMNRQPDPNVADQQISQEERIFRERWRGYT